MGIEDVKSKLEEDGWNISQEFIENNGYQNVHKAISHLLTTDLKHVGISCLPNAASKEKSPKLLSPLVLQVASVRNVAAPKANEESQFAPRMLKITLTDGKGFIQCLEVEPIKSLSLKTPPGTKIKIVSRVSSVSGYYLLKSSHILVLGGIVQDLYEKWKLSKDALKYSRGKPAMDGSGPPPWVPFGKGIVALEEKNEDFKALTDVASKPKDDKFQESRSEVVSKLSQENAQKVFGGGKRMMDTNVQKIINAGFSADQAQEALLKSKNNLDRAFRHLKKPLQSNEELSEEPFHSRGRGRRGGRRKRDVSGPDGSDDEGYLPPSARPSGPASLCDFLDIKAKTQKGDDMYQQQLRELNRYSKYNDYYQDDGYQRNSDNKSNFYEEQASSPMHRRTEASGRHSEFGKSTFQEQSYEKRNPGNGNNRRGTGNYRGNRNNPRNTENHMYAQKDTGSNYYDSKKTGNYHDNTNTSGNYQGSRNQTANYQGSRNLTGNYHDSKSTSGNYQGSRNQGDTYQGGRNFTGNYHDSKHQSGSYHDNRNKSGNYQGEKFSKVASNYEDTKYHGDQYGNRESGKYHDNRSKISSYRGDNYGNRQRGSYQRHADNYHNLDGEKSFHGGGQYNKDYSGKGSSYIREQQPRQQSSYNSNPQLGNNDTHHSATGSRVYTDEEQRLIGQFRQSLEISGDYQPENNQRLPQTDDYHRDGHTEPRTRSQYGRSINYGRSRGQNRGRRAHYNRDQY